MHRTPDWTADEFRVVLNNPTVSAARLAQRLRRRTPASIGVVRQGIHGYHQGRNTAVLSDVMFGILEEKHGASTCPVCRTTF